MTEITLQINRPEDISLVQQLAQRLGIQFQLKMTKALPRIKRKQAAVKNKQILAFEKMEKLRLKLQSLPPQPDIDISQIANEVNGL